MHPFFFFFFFLFLFLFFFFFFFFFKLSGMSTILVCWPKVFFPHRLSSFRNKRRILYPNYTLSFNKPSCECVIFILFPKYSFLFVYFYSYTKVTFRTKLFSSFSSFFHSETKDTSCFIQNRKTHPIPQLYPSCLSN